jgi:hypothetical protein
MASAEDEASDCKTGQFSAVSTIANHVAGVSPLVTKIGDTKPPDFLGATDLPRVFRIFATIQLPQE